MLRVELDHEEDAIIAEMGRMIYKSPQVRWHMTIPGKGFLGKLSGSMKRRMVDEIAMQCQFSGPGEVGFGGSAPCTIISVELVSGQSPRSAARSWPPRPPSASGSPPAAFSSLIFRPTRKCPPSLAQWSTMRLLSSTPSGGLPAFARRSLAARGLSWLISSGRVALPCKQWPIGLPPSMRRENNLQSGLAGRSAFWPLQRAALLLKSP